MRNYLAGIAVTLHDELHQTDDQVKDVIKMAHSCDTMIMAKAKGAIGMTYALSGVPGDLVGKGIASAMKLEPGTPMHNFVAGVAGGMTAVAFKAVLTRVIGSSIQDSRWMQADMDALEPLMKDEAEKRETFGHKLKMTALGGTGFNVRNPVTGGISSATQLLPENKPRPEPMGIIQGALKPGYAINQIAGFGLTSAAGALSGVVENYYDNLHGAEFLFGRNDWKDRYKALSSGHTNSGEGSHFNAVWEHAKAPKRWVEGVTTLSALSAVASETMEALGLGIGAGAARVTKGGAEKLFTSGKTSAAETALDLANKSGFRVSRESIGNAAALVPNAYSYLQQGVFGLLYQEAERAVANKLHPKPADATEEEAPVSSGARTPEGAPAPSVGTEARTPEGTPAPSVGTEARTPEGTPAPSVGTEARTPAGTPAPSTGTRAKGPSEEGESDSDSVHSHNSGPLRNTPPERSSEMRAAGDTSAWWHSFPDLANIKSPQPEKLTQADYEAIIAVLEAEAEKMSERIAEMIPLPDSLPTSSASSVTSGSSASSEAAGPAGSPEPEETKKAS
ncbi:hypothetical protein [Pantoea agglomerans]|uniref:hypothetical protein n=1 Tax=Enterobacter agglomerans TaxID=549 RepID=UPI000DABCFE1|nr:hypothetical protein [Pantoea agglomerans]RAH33462.1 hypothetical protein DOT37_04285 [Pantoea agglomerans]TGX93692.1 hypothetical protein E5821_04270 [Pantoea agglomerans]